MSYNGPTDFNTIKVYQPRYSTIFSGATISSNCMDIGKGNFEWNGSEGTAQGKSCSEARSNYCKKYGDCKGRCYGESGYGDGCSKTGNTYKGLTDAGFKIEKTNPNTGTTILNSNTKYDTSGKGNNNNDCDIVCQINNFLTKNGLPGFVTFPILAVGVLVGIFVLFKR